MESEVYARYGQRQHAVGPGAELELGFQKQVLLDWANFLVNCLKIEGFICHIKEKLGD